MRNIALSTIGATVAGAVLSCLLGELALRPFATAWHPRPATSPYTIRQYYEGFATAHFQSDAERLTGHPEVPGAPNLLLLGDSHVEALQVNDEATMGSLLQQRLRITGVRANIHQYGWSSADAVYYAAHAQSLIERWHPAQVVIVMNPGDFYAEKGPAIGDERSVPGPQGPARTIATQVLQHSALAYHLYRATRQMEEAARLDVNVADMKVVTPDPVVAKSLLEQLKHAYGERLLLVFDDYVSGLRVTEKASAFETSFFQACASAGVHCVSTRSALVHDRYEHQRISRGFQNTTPGEGHWNHAGHEVLADVIYQALQPAGSR